MTQGEERTDLAGDDERDRFDYASAELVGPCNLAIGNIQSAAREEAHAPLGVCRLVFCERVERVALVLVVANVAITRN